VKSGHVAGIENARKFDRELERVIGFSRSASQFGHRALLLSAEGAAGRGKTSTAKHACEQRGGVLVRAREVWKGPRAMLGDIAHGLCGWHVDIHSTSELYARVAEEIVQKQIGFVVIDEADYCDRGGRCDLLNVIRDLSDDTNRPFVFLSVSRLAARFLRPTPFTETVTSRLAARIAFQAPTLKDAALLAAELLEGVTFEADLIGACLHTSGGSLRALLGLYAEVEEAAVSAGARNVSLAKAEQLRAFAGYAAISSRATAASERRRPPVATLA
jgi:hypothetical protein